MARKKTDIEDVELLSADEEVEASEENEEVLELEDSSEEEESEPTPKRSRRKKKEPAGFAAQLLKNSSEDNSPEETKPSKKAAAPVAEETEDSGTEVPEESEKTETEKKARRPRSTPEEKNLSVAMAGALEAMTSHWTKAKEATDALVINLEKVKKDLEEIKVSSSEPLQKLLDSTKEKQAVASRVTFALSLAAMIFSFVSLTLSQSVRSQLFVFQQTQKPAVASAPVSNEQRPSFTSNSLASTERALGKVTRKPKSTKK